MSAIEIRNLTRSIAGNKILNNVSFGVEKGEFLVLLGPSGCGKSTLLRLISGLDFPDAGTIEIDGNDLTFADPKRRDVAMVFQSYALYPHMTVRENIAFPLTFQKLGKSEIATRVAEAARALDLEALLSRKPAQLSGGQRQRVAMGRALVRRPAVFLFDEPLSNLDAKLRVQMRAEIKDLHRRTGATMIYVTHDQMEAATMADRVVVMRDGDIEQIGKPLEVYDRPANRFVAEFVGSPAMNFLEGSVSAGGTSFEVAGANLPLLKSGEGQIAATLGVRPEHFELSETGLTAEVTLIEPTGYETIVLAKIGLQPITVLIQGRTNLAPGDRVMLRPKSDQALFFASEADQRRLDGLALAA